MSAYSHYNAKERRKIACLQRRADWIRQRIAIGGDFTYDRQELAALEWVLGKLAVASVVHTTIHPDCMDGCDAERIGGEPCAKECSKPQVSQ
jgi:hypothetical protein